MINKVVVLQPKYTQSYLPPITADDTLARQAIIEKYNKVEILPTTFENNTSYVSNSQPILRESHTSNPLDSDEMQIRQSNIQPNLQQPIINQSLTHSYAHQSINQSNVQQQTNISQSITKSIVRPTSITHQSVVPTKSIMGTIPQAQPVYKLLRKGTGINPTEKQAIIFCAMSIFQDGITPISNNTAKYIQQKIGGDWLVIVYPEGKPVDFNMTCVEGNDFMYFTLDTTAFQVCRLR